MANGTTLKHTAPLSWQNVIIAFGLCIALVLIAALIGSLVPAPAVALLLAAIAFVCAGLLTMRVRVGAKPAEPAIAAALLVLLLSLAQVAIAPETMQQLTTGQIVLSVVMSLIFAAALAWLGARLGARGGIGAPRSKASSSI